LLVSNRHACHDNEIVESRTGAVAYSPVSHPRSSNRACGLPAHGFPTGFTSEHTRDDGAHRLRRPIGCFAHTPCAVQLRLKVKLFLKNPNFPVVSGQSHSPCRIYFKGAPEVRDLPSPGITRLRRYYFPLRLPPRPEPKALLRVAAPHPGRASHVTQITFLTCCPHYPGGSEQVHLTVTSLSRFGLPRILGGSASTTVLSRPAQGSLALRPARLLQPKSLHLSPGLHQGGLPASMPG
jgi:hypothetical protein